jgi:hypothetical protein
MPMIDAVFSTTYRSAEYYNVPLMYLHIGEYTVYPETPALGQLSVIEDTL